MSENNQPRNPKGVPTGGQWRATRRPEGPSLPEQPFRVAYAIRSGIDGGQVSASETTVLAEDEQGARLKASDWARDNDRHYDDRIQPMVEVASVEPIEVLCSECGGPCEVDGNGVSNHIDADGGIDYDTDADHVAIPEHSAPPSPPHSTPWPMADQLTLEDRTYELDDATDLGHRLAEQTPLALGMQVTYPFSRPRRGTNQGAVNRSFEERLAYRLVRGGFTGLVALPEPPPLRD